MPPQTFVRLIDIHPSGSGGDGTGGWSSVDNSNRVPNAEYWCPEKLVNDVQAAAGPKWMGPAKGGQGWNGDSMATSMDEAIDHARSYP